MTESELMITFDTMTPELSQFYQEIMESVLDTISEMRSAGGYDEDTLETLEWKLSTPKGDN